MGSGAYRPRIVDSQIAEELEAIDAIEIRGAKWVGKTTTAEQFCRSAVYMNDSMRSAQNIALAKIMPAKLLEGEKPRLIDEWQMAPNIWDAVKFEADHGDGPGLFILTGSVRPNTEGIRDIGAGRFSTIVMRTMSLYESGDSTGEVSLRQLFNNQEIWGESKLDLSNVASIVVRGGWPRSCGRSDKAARTIVGAYCEALLRTNVSMPSIGSPDVCSDEEDLGNMEVSERDMEKMRRVLRSLSRNSASQVSISTDRTEALNDNQFIAVARESRNINILGTQSLSSLYARTHDEEAIRTIVSNCNVRLFLYSDDMRTRELLNICRQKPLEELQPGEVVLAKFNTFRRSHQYATASVQDMYNETQQKLAAVQDIPLPPVMPEKMPGKAALRKRQQRQRALEDSYVVKSGPRFPDASVLF